MEDTCGQSSRCLVVQKAQQKLKLAREKGDLPLQATELNALSFYFELDGRMEEALETENDAITIWRGLDVNGAPIHLSEDYPNSGSVKPSFFICRALIHMAQIYGDLGLKQEHLNFLLQALAYEKAKQDKNFLRLTLVLISRFYAEGGDRSSASKFLKEAMKVSDHGVPETWNMILSTRLILGEDKEVIRIGELILRSYYPPTVQEMPGCLTLIGTAYDRLGINPEVALRDELKALHLSTIGLVSLDSHAAASAALMNHFRTTAPAVAILFGTAAIDDYQQERRNLDQLDKQIQSTFLESKSPIYRTLAELLVSQNRLTEAEHVLDLLKDAEYKETVRGAANDPPKTNPLPLTDADRAAEAAIATEATEATSLTDASFEFDRLNALSNPTESDKTKLKDISAKIASGNAAIETFFNTTLYNQLGGDAKSNSRASAADTETSSLSNLLAQLGPGTLALYTLVGDQHSYIIVTTANTRTRYEVKSNAADLGKLILALRQELKSPASDPSKDLATLSHLLLDPIATDVATAAKQSPDGVPTLLWSLDGVLRYVPMNALFDPAQPQGQQYLAERARNVVITPESRNHLLDAPSNAELKAAAFGVSQSYLGLHALNGVPAELDAVVHDPAIAASHGPLQGKLLRDDDFTLTALESTLHQHYPVVHIASHFVFQTGSAGESYLLLGGKDAGDKGYELTMSQLQTDPQLSFRSTHLLTLSACSTAEADTSGNGREIDSLGMVMQKRDAAAVLATLWDVNDTSTSLLMSDFYRRWATTPGIAKIEALRQAQLAMLHGEDAHASSNTDRGTKVEDPTPVTASYAHPYYWAPFVLIGNFR